MEFLIIAKKVLHEKIEELTRHQETETEIVYNLQQNLVPSRIEQNLNVF